jgi:hypothetical protein
MLAAPKRAWVGAGEAGRAQAGFGAGEADHGSAN